MTENIVPLRFNVEEVGKHVKSSKKRFTWQVSLNGRQHQIVLDFSFISGKVKVAVDRKVLLQNQLPANTSFQYPFTLDGNSLNVIQQGQSFELRINNKVFSHLYNQAKTNKEFKKYEDQVKDFKVNENQFAAKKLTLNIGGVGGGMKKKPKAESVDQHNWNAFGGDEMTGFPNYFQGQSVSTAASQQKVEQSPPVAQKKSNSLLDEDQGPTISQQKPQNILDFQAQVQKYPTQTQPITQNQQQFSTMQLMFQTMNLNPTQQPSVVIDSNEVDFFSSNDEQPSNINNSSIQQQPSLLVQQQPQIDFFNEVNSSVSTNQQGTNLQQNDFNTMRYMFATGVNQPASNNISPMAFSTSVNTKTQNTGFNLNATAKQPQTPNISLNIATNQQHVDASNFNTLQGLFATNAMGMNQSTTNTTPVVQPQQQSPVQNNFSLNAQHFATQQLPTQGFGTSYNVNPQTFGTQNFMGQGLGSQDVSFLNQQKTTTQQPIVTQANQSFTQPISTQVSQPASEIDPNNFSSMQLLFKTNNIPTSPVIQTQPVQTPVQQPNMQKSAQSFNQQFATMGGSSVQSPNTMFMNTYGGGSGNANLSFDLGQQFSTSTNVNANVNPSSMMKKKNDVPTSQPTNSNVGDLL